jgi:hypothetical protein
MAAWRSCGAIGLLVLLASSAAFAARWDFMGESHVDGAQDHDRIKVTAAQGTYRAIQFRVRDGAVEFDRVIVHYGNGASEPIPIRARVAAGGRSRIIDLPGDRRVIESIEFWYARGSWGSNRKPAVQVFGMR